MIYFIPHLVSVMGILSFYIGYVWTWSAVIFIFLIFPLIEFLTQKFSYVPLMTKGYAPHLAVYLMPLTLTFVLLSGFFAFEEQSNLFAQLGVVLSTGSLLGAFGITSAHELIHRSKKWERALGVYNLMLVNFAHWGLEHVFGHHKNVGTDIDPATARLNENVYAFWFREYFSSLKSAFKINPKKFSLYWGLSLLLSAALYFYIGWTSLFFWWGSSLVAVLLLQTVDYIEHYGLKRDRRADGSWAPFTAAQAWDSSSYLTNIVLFNLGLHSHHHLKASLPYTTLQVQPTAPRMPVGYSFMVMLALIPWLFLPLMNEELKKNNN